MANLIYSALPQPRRSIVYIHPKLSATQCIDLMIKQNIGALVVRDEDELLGMVSERDIVAALHRGLDMQQATAADILYKQVSILDLFDTVERAMETITKTKRRHVLVTENDELVALLSIGDLLFHLLEDKARVIEHLENYIHT